MFTFETLYGNLLSLLTSLSRQAIFAYTYCFVLVLVVSFIEPLRPLLTLGLLLGLLGLILIEMNTADSTYKESRKNALILRIKMSDSKDIPAILERQLQGLWEEDISWMIENGSEREISSKEVLIREDEPLEALYIALEGVFKVSTKSNKVIPKIFDKFLPTRFTSRGSLVSTVRCGVFGEMSFIRSPYLPSATVEANSNSLVWSVSKCSLEEKISSDPEFGARFYKFVGVVMADRLELSNKLHAARRDAAYLKWRRIFNFSRKKMPKELSTHTVLTFGEVLYLYE